MLEPQTLEECCEAMRACASSRRTVGLSGGDAPRGPVRVAVDEIVSLRRMDRVVEYVPADQIVTVEAGMRLSALQSRLRERQQRLALDPACADETTIGGVVASNAYGPLRARYGTARDVIVGMTIVRADGTAARGGGKVVKNVAGFDLPKLMVGTYGTLAMIATVTFRLHPLPRAREAVVVDGISAAGIRALLAAMVQAQLEPSAVEALFDGDAYRLRVVFEGFAAGVRGQRDRLSTLVPSCRDDAETAPYHEEAARGDVVARMTAPVSQLELLHARAIRPLCDALKDARACMLPSVGVARVAGSLPDDVRALSALRAAREWCESQGGTLVVEAAPPKLRLAFDPWGTPPPAFTLMRALKERFDPQRMLQPGGFVGGL